MKILERITFNVQREKEYTSKIIADLTIISNEKLYAKWGYSTLWNFCVKHLGYSDAEATIRNNAVKLMRKVPEAQEVMNQGQLSLTQANQLGKFQQDEEKTVSEIINIIDQVKGKSTRVSERILDDHREKKKVEKRVTLDERLLKKVREVQADYDDCSEYEAIDAMCDERKYLPAHVAKQRVRECKSIRSISKRMNWQVRERAHHKCQHPGCTARNHLEIDHIIPVAKGGKSIFDNLQLLCRAHNQLKGAT